MAYAAVVWVFFLAWRTWFVTNNIEVEGGMHSVRWLQIVPCLALGIIAGCGSSKGEIAGKVSLNGEPLACGQVTAFDAKEEIIGNATIVKGEYVLGDLPPTGDVLLSVQTFTTAGWPIGVRPKPGPKVDVPKSVEEIYVKGLPAHEQEIYNAAKPVPKKYWNLKESNLKVSLRPGRIKYDIEMTGIGEKPTAQKKKD